MLQFRHMQQRAALCAMFAVLAAATAAAQPSPKQA
jgi:hypothetical protein